MIKNIFETAQAMENEIISMRRDLHKIPEVYYDLPKTTAYVERKLREFGVESIRTGIAGAGIIADIPGNAPGKMIALRADMDGLTVTETSGCAYASTHCGQMHACGHDGHTAMLLAAAKIFASHRSDYQGTVRLIFQPAEEGPPPGGAYSMIQEGALEGVDAIFIIHMSPLEPTGTIAFNTGAAMSALDCFTIEIIGKGGHGSMPHRSIDAITLSAQVINNIQYIVSRQSDPLEPLVLTLGTIQGGTRENIIADSVKISGTMRSYDQGVREKALRDLEHCIKCACDNVGATYQFQNTPAVNPLINHFSATEFLKETLKEVIGEDHVKLLKKPSAASEDSSNYLFKVPGAFMWLGCNCDESTSYPLHHPKFNMDERSLKTGVAAHVAVANRFLNENKVLKFDI